MLYEPIICILYRHNHLCACNVRCACTRERERWTRKQKLNDIGESWLWNRQSSKCMIYHVDNCFVLSECAYVHVSNNHIVCTEWLLCRSTPELLSFGNQAHTHTHTSAKKKHIYSRQPTNRPTMQPTSIKSDCNRWTNVITMMNKYLHFCCITFLFFPMRQVNYRFHLLFKHWTSLR